MIVDLVRNDLARIGQVGSVQVPDLYQIERWAGLWHAHSTVEARVLAGTGLAEVLRAVLPAGSVTGAPKHAALKIISDLEPVGRGPSMGALAWVGRDGSVRAGLTIRTAALDLTGTRPTVAVWAGGGITWSSVAADEVAEARAKAAPLFSALGQVMPSRC